MVVIGHISSIDQSGLEAPSYAFPLRPICLPSSKWAPCIKLEVKVMRIGTGHSTSLYHVSRWYFPLQGKGEKDGLQEPYSQ